MSHLQQNYLCLTMITKHGLLRVKQDFWSAQLGPPKKTFFYFTGMEQIINNIWDSYLTIAGDLLPQ